MGGVMEVHRRRQLPATAHSVASRKIAASGVEYVDELVMVNTTGRAYRVQLVGDPPVWTFTAVPSCADILADFTSSAGMLANVPSCTALLTWGFS